MRAATGARQRGQRLTHRLRVEAEEGGGIDARLQDRRAGLVEQQQRAVRLDRAGEVDLLAFAVREVGIAEGGLGGAGHGIPRPDGDLAGGFLAEAKRLRPGCAVDRTPAHRFLEQTYKRA